MWFQISRSVKFAAPKREIAHQLTNGNLRNSLAEERFHSIEQPILGSFCKTAPPAHRQPQTQGKTGQSFGPAPRLTNLREPHRLTDAPNENGG
jgi:hypothetical protein